MILWEPLEYVGETLVFFGVVGEVFAEWREPERRKVAKASGMVLIVGLALSLAALIGTNEHFNGTIADLNLKASQANERAAKDETEIANANERAADAGLKRAELENRMLDVFGPRRLTAAQSAEIGKKLTGLNGVRIDVYVLDFGNLHGSTEIYDSADTGWTVVDILRKAHVDADGWLLASCDGSWASNLNVSVRPGASEEEQKIASQLLSAFREEIATYPEVETSSPANLCTKFSPLSPVFPNKHPHDAAISITVGVKTQPLLTREMLEAPNEQKKP